MIQHEKPVYVVQGHKFTQQPTSVHFRNIAGGIFGENFTNLTKALDETDASTLSIETLLQAYDEYRIYFTLFCALTDGPHEKLEYDLFDQKVSEVLVRNFFLPATVTMLEQIGFISPLRVQEVQDLA
jgi:hypothetical protein